jgi:hypothetical protein
MNQPALSLASFSAGNWVLAVLRADEPIDVVFLDAEDAPLEPAFSAASLARDDDSNWFYYTAWPAQTYKSLICKYRGLWSQKNNRIISQHSSALDHALLAGVGLIGEIKFTELARLLAEEPAWMEALFSSIPPPPASFVRARGEISAAFHLPNGGDLVLGRAFCAPGGRLRLLTGDGSMSSVEEGVNWSDDASADVFDLHAAYTPRPCFCVVRASAAAHLPVSLLWMDEKRVFCLSRVPFARLEGDVAACARELALLPIPDEHWDDRVDRLDGWLLRRRLELEALMRHEAGWSIMDAGPDVERPDISLIVTLSENFGVTLNQLADLACNGSTPAAVEILYVCEDFRRASEFSARLDELYAEFGLPLKLLFPRAPEDRPREIEVLNVAVEAARAEKIVTLARNVLPQGGSFISAMAQLWRSAPKESVLCLTPEMVAGQNGAAPRVGTSYESDPPKRAAAASQDNCRLEPMERIEAGGCLAFDRELWAGVGGLKASWLTSAVAFADLSLTLSSAGVSLLRCPRADLLSLDAGVGAEAVGDPILRYDALQLERLWPQQMAPRTPQRGSWSR